MTDNEILEFARTFYSEDRGANNLISDLSDSLELALAQLASVREIVELP